MVVTCFSQALRLSVAVVQEHNIAGVSEVELANAHTNLNPLVALHS